MIPIFNIIMGTTIISIIFIVNYILLKNIKDKDADLHKVVMALDKYIWTWMKTVGTFCAILFLIYAINLRTSFNELKYTTTDEYGREIEKYKADDKLIFNSMYNAKGQYEVIDLTGNYNRLKQQEKEMFKLIGIGYLFGIGYCIYNRKNIARRWKKSRLYKYIGWRREQENA